MKLTGQVIVQIGQPTACGNFYNKEVIEKAIESFTKDSLIGQIGMSDSSIVWFKDASHMVNDLRIEDGNLVADITVLDTPRGIDLKKMIEDKMPISFAMAGLGTYKNVDGVKVIEDYKLITINAVCNG